MGKKIRRCYEKMRNKVGLTALAILLVIVIVASSVVVHSIGDMEKGIRESGGKGISSFVQPHFMGIASANSAECVAIIEENQTYERAIVQRKQAELRAFQESQQGTPLSVMSLGDIMRTIPAPSADFPHGLAWDGANLWYVSRDDSSVIHKISPVDGTILGEWTAYRCSGCTGHDVGWTVSLRC